MNKFIALALTVIACSQAVDNNNDDRIAEWEKWRTNRVENLLKPGGWVSLSGLYWMRQGENTFGSGAGNSIQFPLDFPEAIGTLVVENNRVSLIGGIEGLKIDSVESGEGLVFDPDSGLVKVMEYRTYQWHIIERAGDIGIRLKNMDHPNSKKGLDLKYFEYNPDLVVKAGFIPYAIPRKMRMENVLGHEFEMEIEGQLRFRVNDTEYTLEPLDAGDEFFIIFSDETSAIETYGSGRYMYVKKSKAGEKVILDFNKSYNPPCAFTDFATCLLPPPENMLSLRIDAGELDYHMD